MDIKDLTKKQLLEELEKEEQKISRLLRQKSGIDGELKMADFRKNEIQKEINERFYKE